MIEQLVSSTIYIKIYSNRIELRKIESDHLVSVVPETPFTTNRLLIGQFTEADKTLKKGMKKLHKGKWSFIKPFVVIQPMEKTEGGLSQVEERLFQELATSIGVRKSLVWMGHELTDQEVMSKVKSL